MPFFQQGFVDAFEFFGGVPRIILHDNLRSGVLERVGSIVRFNDDFLDVCKHYLFEPRAVNVRRGNEKGKVERSIRYIRDNFFAGRTWTSISDLNAQVLEWCLTDSFERYWRRGETILVKEAFAEEKLKLNQLPKTRFLRVNN
jgi:transposase